MKRSREHQGYGSTDRYRGNYKRYRDKEELGYESKKRKYETEFDLLPVEKRSKIFKVVFDYYTPRSHFVILPRESLHLEGRDYNELNESSRKELVKEATTLISEYQLKGGSILSVHRGSWITTKNKFHAHVCSDVDEFIKVFQQKKDDIPNWPIQSYVTRQWRASKNPKDYEMNVRGYPFKTYFKDEVESILKLKKKEKAKENKKAAIGYESYTLLYHASEPRIGFIFEKGNEDKEEKNYVETLDIMNKFATENGMTNIEGKGEDKGCHLCLVLDKSHHGKKFSLGLLFSKCANFRYVYTFSLKLIYYFLEQFWSQTIWDVYSKVKSSKF